MKSSVLRWLVVVLMMSTVLAGCKNIQLVPRKKEEPTAKRFISVRKYDVHPSLELYTKRYQYWKSWQRELLMLFNERGKHVNEKKFAEAAEQAVSNLMDMRDMLVEEKAVPLEFQIDAMEKVEKDIKREGITGGNRTRLRREVTRIGKLVKRDFSYRDMKPYIRKDFRPEENDQI